MVKAYSKDLREKIVDAYNQGVGTINQIAKMFGVGKRSVEKYLFLYRQGQDLTPQKQPGRPPLLNDKSLEIIKIIVLSDPDGTLYDHCASYKEKTKSELSKSSMWNAYKLLKLNRKKKVFLHQSKRELMYKKEEKTI
jgi:transposase